MCSGWGRICFIWPYVETSTAGCLQRMYIFVCLFVWWTQSYVAQICWSKSFWLKCRSMIWNPWVPLLLQPSERLHELSLPSNKFFAIDARHALKLYEMSCVVLWVRMDEFQAAALCRFCRSVTSVRYCRGHCGEFGFVVAGPPRSAARTSTVRVSSGTFIRVPHERVVEQFCSLALHVSSIKRHGPTWLQRTKRSCIARHIICELYTTFIHDRYQFGNWCVNPSLYPWCAHAHRRVKMFQKSFHFSNPFFLSSLWGGAVWPTEHVL